MVHNIRVRFRGSSSRLLNFFGIAGFQCFVKYSKQVSMIEVMGLVHKTCLTQISLIVFGVFLYVVD